MKKTFLIFAGLFLLLFQPLSAQKIKGGVIWGELLDAFTRESLIGAKVTLLTADSVAVDSIVKTSKGNCVSNVWGAWFFMFPREWRRVLSSLNMKVMRPAILTYRPRHLKDV